MTKYKLIKTYPGSPALGIISTPKSNDGSEAIMHYYSGIWFDPSAYPDYWEKVVEKNYEILSLKSNVHCDILLDKINLQAWENPSNRGSWSIHSVKRLSDGETFTVGDNVTLDGSDQYTGPISKFELDNKGIIVHYKGFDDLKDIIKVIKKPLFTTEDGVDIFEGDKFWNTRFFEANELQVTNFKYPLLFLTDGSKQFSTKEKALEYIFLNKPCLSIIDIQDHIDSIKGKKISFKSSEKELEFIFELKELVKSKLNK